MRVVALLLASVMVAVLLPARGPAAAPASDPYAGFEPRLRQVLESFDATQAKVTSLSAQFTERKEIGLLKSAVVQKGRFYHTKPDKFLWEYVLPEPKMLLMNGKSLIAYYPRQKQAEEIRTRLSKRLVKYFGLGQVFADLKEFYHLSMDQDPSKPDTPVVVMRPRSQRLEKRLLEVRVWIDPKINQVSQLEYREADGDTTTYAFTDIQINPDIAPARYEIDLPDDVHVSDGFSGFFAEKGR
ncbi:MAG: LolA family protein [Candidatus Polarisedimenticolia bacterium]